MAMTVGVGGTVMPPVEGLIRSVQRAEERGYDAVWWPDHLMGWHPESIWTPDVAPVAPFYPNPHIYLDPVACIAAAGVHTSRIRLGTAVTEPIRRHPAMLANAWLTLDHLTKGRAILGIGAGEGENIIPYGLSYERPVAKLEEALEIIRLLWANPGVPVDRDGEFWPLHGAVVGLSPFVEGRPPPIWTGAVGPRMLEITGRLADGWLPPALSTPEEYEGRLGVIRSAASKAGRDADEIEAAVYATVVLATDHEEAHCILDTPVPKGFLLTGSNEIFERHGVEHPFGPSFYGLKDYIPARMPREEALKAIDAIPFSLAHEMIAHGTPDDVVALMRPFESAGARHVLFVNITFLGDATKTGESYRLLDAVVSELGR